MIMIKEKKLQHTGDISARLSTFRFMKGGVKYFLMLVVACFEIVILIIFKPFNFSSILFLLYI